MKSSRGRTDIQLIDLNWQYRRIRKRLNRMWKEAHRRSSYVLGPFVSEFEEKFASFSGAGLAVGVANGTDAIELGLRALGIGPGDEVIVPVNSFIASAVAVSRTGAKPVFVDCLQGSWLIDVTGAEQKITPKTRAIMAVHLYGQMANMGLLVDLAEQHGVLLIEDSAQSHGASQNGRTSGSIGVLAATSFYPGKNLGAMGDGGAVLTNSNLIAQKVRALRNYGGEQKYQHDEMGFNSRLDELQASVLLAKLPHLADWNALRRKQADRYMRLLSDVQELTLPRTEKGNVHVWHLFVVLVPNRDAVADIMRRDGIVTGIHYPRPINGLGAYRAHQQSKHAFPVADQLSKTALTLPLYPGLSRKSQERVVTSLKSALKRSR